MNPQSTTTNTTTTTTTQITTFELREYDDFYLIEHGIACNEGHTHMQNMKGIIIP